MHAKTYISVVTIFFVLSISSALFMDRAFSQSTACNYYASPTGTGNGISQSSPFKISDFWAVAKPGYVLCLLDGTYTGSSSMITPPQNLKGTSSSPITVRALNDGKVLINGQGARSTVMLYNNDWFVIEGINACCSNQTVVHIAGSNNVVRRVAAWDAADGNYFIFGVHSAQYNLLEDVAGWGIARKIFESSWGGNFTTIRRAWGSWDGSHFVGPKMTFTLAYSSYNVLVENAVGTWTGRDMKQTYTLSCDPGTPYSGCNQTFSASSIDQPQGIFSVDGLTGANKNANTKLLGSIAYVQGTGFPYNYAVLFSGMDSLEVANTVAYIAPGSNSNRSPFGLDGMGIAGVTATKLVANNLTGIGGAASSISSDWQKSNIVSGASVGAIYGSGENIFNTSRGANLCYRYQDGALTTTPLWPWPMNQRIKDAMVASGRSSVDVTATIESMFGSIPATCKSGTQAIAKPSAPINLQTQR